MKATKGTQITCSGDSCKQVAGSFAKDLEDASPITTDDILIDGEVAIPGHDGGTKWSCLSCNAPVAELIGEPRHWKVHTARGWIA